MMRNLLGPLTAAALLFQPGAVLAQLPSAASTSYPKSETSAFDVNPGDDIVIACAAVERRAADSDVRVVLTISALPGEPAPSYAKVLATHEQLLKDAVRVSIPDLPNLEDRTVGLDVYVVGAQSAEHCDAGHVKIS